MSLSAFSHRFQRNPWPWLIGTLLLILSLMWVREYRIYKEEESCLREKRVSPRKRPVGFGLTSLMLFAGPPQFVDPFGNAYYLSTKSSFSVVSPGPPTSHLSGFVCTANWDRSIGRTLAYDPTTGFTYKESAAATDIILPILSSSLLLTFTVLWIRNARRSSLPQP